jgi:hypothetical protein
MKVISITRNIRFYRDVRVNGKFGFLGTLGVLGLLRMLGLLDH